MRESIDPGDKFLYNLIIIFKEELGGKYKFIFYSILCYYLRVKSGIPICLTRYASIAMFGSTIIN